MKLTEKKIIGLPIKMFRPHEGARLYTRVLLESQEGRGIGMFAKEDIPCGAMIVDEVLYHDLQFSSEQNDKYLN